MYYLPLENRKFFTDPIGKLYENFEDIVDMLKNHTVYTVGDVVTHNALNNGITPAISIIDGITKRGEFIAINATDMVVFNVNNEAGTINDDLIVAIGNADLMKPSIIVVNGEEDLALLPLAAIAEDNSIILYGQPNEGVVVCNVNKEFRTKIVGFWKLLESD